MSLQGFSPPKRIEHLSRADVDADAGVFVFLTEPKGPVRYVGRASRLMYWTLRKVHGQLIQDRPHLVLRYVRTRGAADADAAFALQQQVFAAAMRADPAQLVDQTAPTAS